MLFFIYYLFLLNYKVNNYNNLQDGLPLHIFKDHHDICPVSEDWFEDHYYNEETGPQIEAFY